MSNRRPLAVKPEGGGYKLEEFKDGDTIPISLGGTGATTPIGARTNLEVPSFGDIQTVVDALSTHETNSNPHNITAALIGAALQQDLITHIGDTENPHNVSPSQIGAATPSDISAAILAHLDHNNPHNVSASGIGAVLESVFTAHINNDTAHGNYISSHLIGESGGVCDLDAGGKIPASRIPAIAIPSVHVVTSEVERTSLVVQEGDEAIQVENGSVSYWVFSDQYGWLSRDYGQGDVIGPNTSSENAIVVFSTTTGKQIIQATGLTNTASGEINGRNIAVDGQSLDSAISILSNHINNSSNPHDITAASIGAIPASIVGQPNGIPQLDNTGKVPASQLPQVSSALPPDFAYVQEKQVQTFSGTWWTEAVRLELNGIQGGKYRVHLSFGFNADTTNSDIEVRVVNSSYQEVWEMFKFEPKESGGSFGGTGSNQRMQFSKTLIADLAQHFDQIIVEFRSEANRTEVSLWDVYLEVWRVGA